MVNFLKLNLLNTSQNIATDLACPSINVNSSVTLGTVEEVQVQINKYGYVDQNNYTVRVRNEDGDVLVSALEIL
jgi:hypothetical protein